MHQSNQIVVLLHIIIHVILWVRFCLIRIWPDEIKLFPCSFTFTLYNFNLF